MRRKYTSCGTFGRVAMSIYFSVYICLHYNLDIDASIYIIDLWLIIYLRFFDRENKNLLTFEQFKKLLRHIRKGKKMPIDESVLEKEADMYTM